MHRVVCDELGARSAALRGHDLLVQLRVNLAREACRHEIVDVADPLARRHALHGNSVRALH